MSTVKLSPAAARAARMRGVANVEHVATIQADRVSVDRPWAAEVEAMESDIRERDMRRIGFGQRSSLCG
jgi:hypothetical protein